MFFFCLSANSQPLCSLGSSEIVCNSYLPNKQRRDEDKKGVTKSLGLSPPITVPDCATVTVHGRGRTGLIPTVTATQQRFWGAWDVHSSSINDLALKLGLLQVNGRTRDFQIPLQTTPFL